MSFNIPSSIINHMSQINATINFDTISDKRKKMIETYTRTGIMRTQGIAYTIATYLRKSERKQIVVLWRGSISCRNIVEEDVYKSILSAATCCRINGISSDPHCYIMSQNDKFKGMSDLNEICRRKEPNFSVRLDLIDDHFHLKKLSDPMEVNISEPLTVNLRKFL
jgi:hypothetical protein